MTISFIVPLFRGQKYISEIINNINEMIDYLKNNDYKIELVFVNDDPGEKIVEIEEALSIGNVIIYNNETNIGIHASRVKGLELSSGQYVCFFDQDDYLDVSYLDKMIHCAINNNSDVVLCNGIYRSGRKIYDDDDAINAAVSNTEYFKSLISIISPGQAFIRRNAIPEGWIKYILSGNYCDDAFLWLLLKENDAKFDFVDDILYYHNENGHNQSFAWGNNAKALEELKLVINSNSLLCKEHLDDFLCAANNEISKHRFYANVDEKINYYIDHLDEFKWLLQKYMVEKLAIYGYGIIGKAFLGIVKEIKIGKVIAIDKNLQYAEEVELYSLSEIIDSKKLEGVNDYSVIVTVGSGFEAIKNELLKAGFKNIYSIEELLI